MTVVFDATILLPFLQLDSYAPRDPITNDPVERPRERIEYLIEVLEKEKSKIVIPAPALSEILVRSDSAGSEYLDIINRNRAFRIESFDQRAAIELAAMTNDAKKSGNKRGDQEGTWAKIKFDRQIIAIAKVVGANTIYSDDNEIHKLGKKYDMTIVRACDLPIPKEDKQISLDFDNLDLSDTE